MAEGTQRIVEIPELRDRVGVFRDREDAGSVLARLIALERPRCGAVLAIPSGGIPVALPIARALSLPLDVAVVSKVTPTWNSEVGYGAVAFDGTLRLNDPFVRRLGLTAGEVEADVAATRQKVARRIALLRSEQPLPELGEKAAVLVDDGLASGFTMKVAVEALRHVGARVIWIAVPTGHEEAVIELARSVEALFCLNIRGGYTYAVADAYARWSDVSESEALELLRKADRHPPG